MMADTDDLRLRIARRCIQELRDGDVVNLGAGIPGMIPPLLPPELSIMIHSENGIIGEMALTTGMAADPLCVNASNIPCALNPRGSFFDSSVSFGVARGGHLDCTVLGAMQVDAKGNMANYTIPGGRIIGMGGAMDLVVGARKVVAAFEHTTKKGEPKILRECTFPLTGRGVVDLIITELCVIEVTPEGLSLNEIAEGVTLEEVIAKTGADLIIPPKLKGSDNCL
jgi:acetate CoA/acetoacetate CoA-transferase beta subunit